MVELFLEGRVDAVLDLVERLPHVSAYCSDAHLAKALILLQRDRLGDARAESTARASSSVLPATDQSHFVERAALVELFVTGW